MSEPRLVPGDALLIVDMQNDFLPGGLLPLESGLEVVPVLNRWIEAASEAGYPVFASRDWHAASHVSFVERGGPWPVHCVMNTPGAEISPDLLLPPDTVIIDKGSDPDKEAYSAFDGTELGEHLRRAGVRRLWVGGVALDYCVRASVLDGVKLGAFEVHLILDATRAADVEPGDGERAVEEMRTAGALIEELA